MDHSTSGNGCNNTDGPLRHVILLTYGSVAGISLTACIVALSHACICRVGRRFTHRILLFAVAFNSVTRCLQLAVYNYDPTNTAYVIGCKAIVALLEFSTWTTLLYMSVLVSHLSCLVTLIEIRPIILLGVTYRELIITLSEPADRTSTKARRQALCLEICYVFVPIVISLLFVWIPFLHDAYGLAGAWCWIRQKDDNCDSLLAGKIEQYVLGYGPVSFLCIVAMVIVTAMLVILCKRLYFQETPDQVYKTMLRENAPLMIYPVLFHIVKLLGLAHRLYQITTTIHNNTILWIIHAAIAPLNSLSCAIVYSLFVIIEHFHKEPQPDEARHNERDPLLRSESNIVDD